jgi:hypothetical protein
MTAALELAGLSPELLEAIVDQVAAKLSLVPPPPPTFESPDGLSVLPASIRRRECERRQRDALRAKRSPEAIGGLSNLPGSVRTREYRRRLAAAKKGPIASIARDPLDLQPVNTGEATAGGALRADRIPTGTHGPLAGDVASLVGRVTGYAESARKRDLAWLYEEATRIFRGELGLRLPERWSGPKDWGAAKVLIREYKREPLLEAIRAACKGWKPSAKYPTRPTLGLVLFQLRRDRAAAPAPAPDSRRMTGEQLEERDRARARAAAPPPTKDPRTATSAPTNREPVDQAGRARLTTPGPAEAAVRPAGSGGCAAGIPSPAPPIGPRDLRGTPPREVRGKIAEILEQLEQRRGGGPP